MLESMRGRKNENPPKKLWVYIHVLHVRNVVHVLYVSGKLWLRWNVNIVSKPTHSIMYRYIYTHVHETSVAYLEGNLHIASHFLTLSSVTCQHVALQLKPMNRTPHVWLVGNGPVESDQVCSKFSEEERAWAVELYGDRITAGCCSKEGEECSTARSGGGEEAH